MLSGEVKLEGTGIAGLVSTRQRVPNYQRLILSSQSTITAQSNNQPSPALSIQSWISRSSITPPVLNQQARYYRVTGTVGSSNLVSTEPGWQA